MKQLVFSDGSGVEALHIWMTTLTLSLLLVAATSTFHTKSRTSGVEPNSTNGTRLNTADYWAEDQPYKYLPHWTRLPDGKVVANDDSSINSFVESRGTVDAKTPWISQWVLSTEGRHTLKKDVPRMLMYNLVSPMDYGNSVRSGNVRRRRNKAIRMFLTDNLALPLLKSLGHVAWNLIQTHYVGYFEDEMFAKRLEMMNASEMIQEFNLTLPLDVIEAAKDDESLPNMTLPYVYNGEKKRNVLYTRYTASFAPYEGYSNQYYTRDDSLPPSTFPADSYPWLWSPRLSETRTIAYQLLKALEAGDKEVYATNASSSVPSSEKKLDSCLSNCIEPESRKLVSLANRSSCSSSNTSIKSIATGDIQALEQIQAQLQEFYFDSGVPRIFMRSNDPHSVFPSRTEFLQTSLMSDKDANLSTVFENRGAGSSNSSNGVKIFKSVSLQNFTDDEVDIVKSTTDFSTRSGVYTALAHFYAYPSVDKWMNCTAERPCLVRSGVTVYTPSLCTLPLFQAFADSIVNSTMKRTARLKALQDMVRIAFEAEQRALHHGLQGPSTVWYSNHDLDVDEFADAVLGTVNISITGDTGDSTPLHMFEKHMNERVSILDEVVSYYADTIHDIKVSKRISMLDAFEESELVELISLVEAQMKHLDRAIVSYVETRAANPLYQEAVNVSNRGDLYNGSEYTLVGFGFVIPATNDKNVLYRDMKLPVPFHLVLRLLVRFQETHLLRAEESRQLVVCLAMAVFNLPFYRCRPTATDSSDE